MHHFPHKLILIFALAFLLLSGFYVSAETRSPARDPLCWTKALCTEDSGEFAEDESGRCTGSWGLCYQKPASGETPLQVAIGGVTKVTNISQYVRLVYQVGLGIAFIFSIVLIMVAGFRWMTAGGNATAVGQAKSMIGNVSIGLILLLGAYLIFQTINPDITKLTLPNVPKIRAQTFSVAVWCDDLFSAGAPNAQIKFGFAGHAPRARSSDDLRGDAYVSYTRERMAGRDCGEAFYPLSDPSDACFARGCRNNNEVCVLQDNRSYDCEEGFLGGNISYTPGRDVESVNLFLVCNNGEISNLRSADLDTVGDGRQRYIFKGSLLQASSVQAEVANCIGRGGEKGLMLTSTVNETGGIEDTYAINRNCRPLSVSDDATDLGANFYRNIGPTDLFQRAELATGGTGASARCDLNIGSGTFTPITVGL